MNLKVKLIIMNFLEFAVWGSYLTCMGGYLATHGLAGDIGWFYAVQGIVSLFMPALLGIVADRWIQAQRVLSLAHVIAGVFMLIAGAYAMSAGDTPSFWPLFLPYTISVAFFMPTIGLANSVAFNALTKAGMDTVKAFPPIRVFGTIGFICAMLTVDFTGLQHNYGQFFMSGGFSILLAIYALFMPKCPVNKNAESSSLVDVFGLRAFTLFKQKKMAIFFIFSMLLGVSLQITNGFANPFLTAFEGIKEYADTFAAQHANALMPGVILFVLSCVVYGVAFDFFNISGALYVDQQTDESIRSSAQGLFMVMTNGIGATIGTLSAQAIVDHFVNAESVVAAGPSAVMNGWATSWYIFAAYALVVAVSFFFIFKDPRKEEAEKLKTA